jgi:GNAT superfamily N-acetyltransferase
MNVRRAEASDAPAMASLHVRAWQWAYRGLLADAYLDALTDTVDRRARFWRTVLSAPHSSTRVWVAEAAGRIVGFASVGPSRDPDAGPATAELYAIYVEPAAVGTGTGRALLAHAVGGMRLEGYAAATAWVLEGNVRARRFYRLAGWRVDGMTKAETEGGVEFREFRIRLDLASRPS